MWNESRRDYLNSDTYRAKTVIQVFETVGFKQTGHGNRVTMMSFTDKKRDLEDFMIRSGDEAVLARDIFKILEQITLPVAFFDYIYDSIFGGTGKAN